MTRLTFTLAITVLAAMAMLSDQAQARRYVQAYAYGLPYPISYDHNYGPGALPGTFADSDHGAGWGCLPPVIWSGSGCPRR